MDLAGLRARIAAGETWYGRVELTLTEDEPELDATLLEPFGALQELVLRGVRRITHPEALDRLPPLRCCELERAGASWESYAPLLALPSVRALCLRAPDGAPPSLARLAGLEHLTLEGHFDLAGLELARPTTLRLQNAPRLRSLAWLRGLVHVHALELLRVGLEVLSGLDAAGPRALVIERAPLRSLDGLASASLRSLVLRSLARLESTDGVQGAPELRALAVEGAPVLRDLRGVRALPHLRTLACARVPKLASLGDLDGAPALEVLEVRAAPALRDVRAASTLPSLRALDFTGASALRPRDLALLARARSPRLGALRLGRSGVRAGRAPAALRPLASWDSGEVSAETRARQGFESLRVTTGPGRRRTDRARLAEVLALLGSPRLEEVARGVEVARASRDGALFDALLGGFVRRTAWPRFAPEGVTRSCGVLLPSRVLATTSAGRADAVGWALRELVAAAPPGSRAARRLRATVDALEVEAVPGLDALPFALPALACFPSLRELSVGLPEDVPDARVDLRGGERLRALELRGQLLDTAPLANYRDLEVLRLDSQDPAAPALGPLPSLPALRVLELTRVGGPPRTVLRGLPHLAALRFAMPRGVEELVLEGLSALTRVELAVAPTLARVRCVGCAPGLVVFADATTPVEVVGARSDAL